MLSKDRHKIFSEKIKARFIDLGFPYKTASAISKTIKPVRFEGATLVAECQDAFYREQIILPKLHEVESIVRDCWGKEFHLQLDESLAVKVSDFALEGEITSKLYTFSEGSHQDDETNPKVTQNKSETMQIMKADTEPNQDIDSLTLPDFHSENDSDSGRFDYSIDSPVNETNFNQTIEESTRRSLIAEFTFDTFVRGESNLVAYSACEAVSRNPGNLSNPLFIYGSTGLGKTHLLHSVGNEIKKRNHEARILYVTSIDFVNEVIQGIRFGKMDEIRKKYYNCDILLVDDIQFLENKDTCQVEFFHTFNELYQRRKQIIITSDKFPKDIPNIEERLKSRFMQGLLCDVEPPGFEDRVAIIETKCRQLSLKLTREIIFLLATHVKTNVREIEGILKTMLMAQHMTGKPATIESTTNLLKRVAKFQGPSLEISTIQKIVAGHFQIKMSDLNGQNRSKKFVVARHIAMYLSKELLGLSVNAIAESFGKRDHTTVMHALNKAKETIEKDEEIRAKYSEIKRKINLSLE